MIHIVGEGTIPEAASFNGVRDALESLPYDVYLCSHIAPLLGITLHGEVIYNVEPLYDGCRSLSIGYMGVLKTNTVLDYDRRNVRYLREHGVTSFFLPYGFHQSLVRPTPPVTKDIDFLLVGSRNPRREHLLQDLHHHGRFEWVQGVYGVELDKLIARARVHLNVHYADSHPLEVVRLNYLMANGCTVVSEWGHDPQVNQRYSGGLCFTTPEMLVETCVLARDNPKPPEIVSACIRTIPHDNSAAVAWLRGSLSSGR